MGVRILRPDAGAQSEPSEWQVVQSEAQRLSVGGRLVNFAVQRRSKIATPSLEEWYVSVSIVSTDGGLALTSARLQDGSSGVVSSGAPRLLDCGLDGGGRRYCRHIQNVNVRLSAGQKEKGLTEGLRVTLRGSLGDAISLTLRPVLFQAIQRHGDRLK